MMVSSPYLDSDRMNHRGMRGVWRDMQSGVRYDVDHWLIDILHDQLDLLISTEKSMYKYRDLPILGLVLNYDQWGLAV